MAAEGSYAPRLRTGVVLCGVGTAGAYHAGVWRALVEAGVKIDLVAGHGAGVATALCAAVDGGARLWGQTSPWTSPRVSRAYRWRPALRLAAIGIALAGIVVCAPLVVLVWAAIVYGLGLLASLVNLPDLAAWFVDLYSRTLAILFQPPFMPTIVPRTIVLAMLAVVGVIVAAGVTAAIAERSRRRLRGAWWWRLLGAPLDSAEPGGALRETLWALVRGASSESTAAASDLGRRYAEILTDNLGQPGFREVLVAVHDVDARRDLVGALLAPDRRAAFTSRRHGLTPREGECVDLAGPHAALLADFLAGSQRLPLASSPHVLAFPADSYWRGEEHRVCDRSELPLRLLDEMAALGVEQILLVSPAAPARGPHGLRASPVDLRGRAGEVVRSVETSIVQDAWSAATTRFSGVFIVRPDHNAVGPFDFGGAYDEASDRRRSVAELMQQGYLDAYRQFIEPVVAAGDRLEVI